MKRSSLLSPGNPKHLGHGSPKDMRQLQGTAGSSSCATDLRDDIFPERQRIGRILKQLRDERQKCWEIWREWSKMDLCFRRPFCVSDEAINKCSMSARDKRINARKADILNVSKNDADLALVYTNVMYSHSFSWPWLWQYSKPDSPRCSCDAEELRAISTDA